MENMTLVGQGRQAQVYLYKSEKVVKLFYNHVSDIVIELEYENTKAVYKTGLPIPKISDSVEIDGRKGIIYEHIKGDSLLNVMTMKPWKIISLSKKMAEYQTKVHQHTVSGLPSQREYLERHIRDAKVVTDSVKQIAIEQLNQLPHGDSLCHGDFHPENILLTSQGPIIIDWESAKHGHPLADVVQSSIILSTATMPPEFPLSKKMIVSSLRRILHSTYLNRYCELNHLSMNNIKSWWLPIAVALVNQRQDKTEQERLLKMIKRNIIRRDKHANA
jgi:uncharacterized protein (TIGR02172 family)